MTDILSKFIDIAIPITSCNFRCKYCYITQHRLFKPSKLEFNYSPETFRRAFSQSRFGGQCMLNFCAGGETLLSPVLLPYIKAVLEEGHYCMIVTNGTCTSQINQICAWPDDIKSRLFIKFSYHYQQLKERNLFKTYFDNIKNIKSNGISFTVELVADDRQIQFIPEIKNQTMTELGALCHVTVPRNEQVHGIQILTSLQKSEFYNIWKQFNSKLFEYKFSIFGKKQTDKCLGGQNTFFAKMGKDACYLAQCYCGKTLQNLMDFNVSNLQTQPICKCPLSHCYNGHAWIVFGAIPTQNTPTYAELRNRVCTDGSEWLTEKMKSFMSQKTK